MLKASELRLTFNPGTPIETQACVSNCLSFIVDNFQKLLSGCLVCKH